ncbi:MAG TPA: hypothetical protein VGQ55_07690 [Pyrinomonadaceae bacterium]|jgi:hypothetical protein|nr:hypothetical protein [Pyrinomonadaceae bacterium]
MEQQQQPKSVKTQDSPIPKPADPFPEDFLVLIRSRFTTKKRPKEYNTQTGYQPDRH